MHATLVNFENLLVGCFGKLRHLHWKKGKEHFYCWETSSSTELSSMSHHFMHGILLPQTLNTLPKAKGKKTGRYGNRYGTIIYDELLLARRNVLNWRVLCDSLLHCIRPDALYVFNCPIHLVCDQTKLNEIIEHFDLFKDTKWNIWAIQIH